MALNNNDASSPEVLLELGEHAAADVHPDVDAPEDVVLAATSRKEPPPETLQGIYLRTAVILSFWAIIVFFGLPLWWKTTAIYRADLPLDEMMDWDKGVV